MTRRGGLARPAAYRGGIGLVLVVLLALLFDNLSGSAPRLEEDISLSTQDVFDRDLPVLTCHEGLFEAQVDVGPDASVGIATSEEVVACPELFDPDRRGGPLVTVAGEVVGDVLVRGGGAWILLNDDDYALGGGPLAAHRERFGTNSGLAVWLPEEVIDATTLTPGRPDMRGDILVMEGRIHRADRRDGGGLSVRAEAAAVAVEATPAEQPLHERQGLVAVLFVLLAVATTLMTRMRLRQR